VLAVGIVGAGAMFVVARQTIDGWKADLFGQASASGRSVQSASDAATGSRSGSATGSPGGSGTSSTPATPPAGVPTGSTATATPASSQSLLPAVSAAQMQQDIRAVLLEYHEDVIAGNYSAAWSILSERKRQQDLQQSGYASWEQAQSSLAAYLDPSGIEVRILASDRRTGVATVDVSGMSWDKPGASCTDWSGITWVKYETGGWHYDPGYSTTTYRNAAWKSRFRELLGGSC
jgi:hypothetical protein